MDRDSLYQEAQLLTQTSTASNGGNEHGLDDQVIDDTMDRPTSSVGNPPKAFPWELIPFEIRQLIFELLDTPIQREWFVLPPVLPPLLVALRRLSVSYNHAVQHFQKCNKFLDMDAYSRHLVLHMTKTELLVVESVRLDVGHPIWLKRKQLQKRGVAEDPQAPIGKLHCFTSSFLLAENLRELHLSIDGRYGANDDDIMHFITEFPFWIEGCKALSKLNVELPIQAQYIDVRRRDAIVRTTIKRLVKKVGVRGHYVCTRPLPCDGNWIEVWEWVAPPGTFMNWAQDLGRVWKNPRFMREYYQTHQYQPWSFLDDCAVGLAVKDGACIIDD